MLQIVFDDKDLEELITTGYNRKYRKYTRNEKFMQALAIAYNYLRNAESTNDLRRISFLHYEQLSGTNGNKKWESSTIYGGAPRDDD